MGIPGKILGGFRDDNFGVAAGEEWVEWSATGLKDASVFDLSPTGRVTGLPEPRYQWRFNHLKWGCAVYIQSILTTCIENWGWFETYEMFSGRSETGCWWGQGGKYTSCKPETSRMLPEEQTREHSKSLGHLCNKCFYHLLPSLFVSFNGWWFVCLRTFHIFSHLFIFLHRCSPFAAPGTSTQIRDKLLPFIRCQSRLKQLVARWVSVDSSMKDVLKLSACNTLKVWLSMPVL